MVSDIEAMIDFFKSEGSCAVLLAVDPEDGNLTGEIKERVPTAPNTVTERLNEAEDIGLLRSQGAKAGDHGNANRYYLTQDGRVCLVAMVSLNMDEAMNAYIEILDVLNKLTEEMVGWAEGEASLFLEDGRPDVPEEGISDQFELGGAYPGDDLPDNYESFIFESDFEDMEVLNPTTSLDYEQLK